MGVSTERYTSFASNWKCVLICLGMGLANCQYGFDAATVGGFQAMAGFLEVFGYRDPKSPSGWNIETQPQQLITSCMNIGTIIGVFFSPMWAKYFGRRPAIWIASLVTCVSLGIQLGATSVSVLCVGRVTLGIANAWYMIFANTYTVEVTPPHLRAPLASVFGLWVNIGSILGTVVDNETNKYGQTPLAYQVPLAVLFLTPVILCLIMLVIPESPRWQLVSGKPAQAERSLERLRGNSLAPEFLKEEYEEMVRGIEEEKALARGVAFADIFRGTDLRRTLLCLGITVSHSSSGVWLFIAYGTYFFQMAGIRDAFRTTIYVVSATLVGTFVGMYCMYKVFGRRTMMLIGTGVSVIAFLGAAISYTIAPGKVEAGQAIIGFIIIYTFFSNGFAGNLSWPLANEMISSRLRITTFSFSTGVNYFFSWLIAYCSPFFINTKALNWGGKYCYIWAGSNAITWVFFYLFLPEVKGRSLEEIDELFQNRVSVKQFPRYQTISAVRAHEAALQDLGMTDKHVAIETVEVVDKGGLKV